MHSKTCALIVFCAALFADLALGDDNTVYFSFFPNDKTCTSTKSMTTTTSDANTCLNVGTWKTRDSEEVISGLMYKCPAEPISGNCGSMEVFTAAGCAGTSYTQQMPCDMCQGSQEGYQVLRCDESAGTLTLAKACDSTCTTCKNTTELSTSSCTDVNAGEPIFVKPAADPIAICDKDFIAMTLIVRTDGNAGSAADACTTSETAYKRTRMVEADACFGGSIASCNEPSSGKPSAPPPVIEPFVGDMCVATEHPIYQVDELPTDCYAPFVDCASALCLCVGQAWDNEQQACTGEPQQVEDTCLVVPVCLTNYVTCVNLHYNEAEDGGFAANCTSQAAMFTYYHDQALQNVINPNFYNTSDLFASCENFVCNMANRTKCDFNPSSVCVPPPLISEPITPTPGSTPAPTNPDGSYAVPTKIVRVVLVFVADFDNLVSSASGKKQLKDVMTDSLTKKLKYKTVTKQFRYVASNGLVTTDRRKQLALAAGSLTVTAEATVPSSDTATLNSVLANVNALKSDTSTSWYSGLSSACGCTIPAPTVSSSVVDGGAAQPPSSPSAAACSSGCVAGVVIGGTVAVTAGVGTVAYFSMKKTAAAIAPEATAAKGS